MEPTQEGPRMRETQWPRERGIYTPDLTKPKYRPVVECHEATLARQPEPLWKHVAGEVQSTREHNLYGWMPSMRGWVDEAPKANGYEVPNRSYEMGIEISRSVLDRGVLIDEDHTLIAGQAVAAARMWDLALALALEKNGPCFDGRPFFHPEHPVYPDHPAGGVYCNVFRDGGVRQVGLCMHAMVGNEGLPIGIMPSVVMVPPALADHGPAHEAMEWAYAFVVNPYLTDPRAFYVFDSRKAVKALMVQVRQAPVLVGWGFTEDGIVLGVDARGAVAYGLPFLAAKVVLP